MADTFHWLDVEQIAEELAEAHPGVDPLGVNFVDLKRMVLALPGFEPQPEHPVNERILEVIQSNWNSEYRELQDEEEEGN